MGQQRGHGLPAPEWEVDNGLNRVGIVICQGQEGAVIGDGSADTLYPFLALIHLPESTYRIYCRICKISGADPRTPIEAVEACPGIRE